MCGEMVASTVVACLLSAVQLPWAPENVRSSEKKLEGVANMFIEGGSVLRRSHVGVEDGFEFSRDMRIMRRASCAAKGGCQVAKMVTPASCVVATLTGGAEAGQLSGRWDGR